MSLLKATFSPTFEGRVCLNEFLFFQASIELLFEFTCRVGRGLFFSIYFPRWEGGLFLSIYFPRWEVRCDVKIWDKNRGASITRMGNVVCDK